LFVAQKRWTTDKHVHRSRPQAYMSVGQVHSDAKFRDLHVGKIGGALMNDAMFSEFQLVELYASIFTL